MASLVPWLERRWSFDLPVGAFPAVLERLIVQHAAKRRSAEASEGLASFAEKRAASWFASM